MKRILLATCSLLVVVPDTAALAYQAYQPHEQTRPARPARPAQRPARPTRPVNRPSRPTIQPVRPPHANRPIRPSRPSIQPVRPNRPTRPSLPTYRPGQSRPSTFHRMRLGAFHYPRGYRYRRFRIGFILPALFLSSYYFFNDYYDLGIGPPPPGYVWVRYGPDLLLVNRHTGRIIDVIYGAFY